MYRILISDALHPEAIAWLKSQSDVELVAKPGISKEAFREILGEFDGLIVRSQTQVGAEEIRRGRRLKVIGRAGTGLDNIDVGAARRAGVLVLNTPEANANAVAELTIGLILALARQLPRAFTSRERLKPYGWELQGKALGILGLGRIGSRVAHLAAAFGMSLRAHELDPQAGPKELAIERVDFDSLLGGSDVLTIHVPLTDETRCLLDGEALRRVKRGLFIVNTARAAIVDENALLGALEGGRVAGYAADVASDERLRDHPRVILTPHIGAQTEEAQRLAGIEIAQKMVSALRNPRMAKDSSETDSA